MEEKLGHPTATGRQYCQLELCVFAARRFDFYMWKILLIQARGHPAIPTRDAAA